MQKIKNVIGKTFGTLCITKDFGMILPTPNSKKKSRFLLAFCISCNKKCKSTMQSIKSGHKKCICSRKPKILTRKRIFTSQKKRIYKIHYAILQRCNDVYHKQYNNYGGRGITICSEWQKSYLPFYEWSLENGYQENLTIDRIDNSKGYSPENCRWITLTEQARNRRNTITMEKAKEIKKLLAEGYTHQAIANMVNTTNHRVSHISKGTSWNNITIKGMKHG